MNKYTYVKQDQTETVLAVFDNDAQADARFLAGQLESLGHSQCHLVHCNDVPDVRVWKLCEHPVVLAMRRGSGVWPHTPYDPAYRRAMHVIGAAYKQLMGN
ncbi:hypothetical protein [Methylopila sp. 73B]|uniref:hypothetical protein n=1 Tax=Methylopila sp. 73B TaxID=1120792 RepID=UPI0003677B1C|nr:hypothetical protein [Methylopila sp. 73B]